MVGRPLASALLLVALLAIACYTNSLRCGFVLDDTAAILDHPAVTHFSLARIFDSDFRGGSLARGDSKTSAYRPWVTLSFAIDWLLGGGRAWMFHLTNLLLHVTMCLLLCAGLWSLLPARAATAAAALFAVHPLHTDAVTSLVGRADVWCGIATALVWWLHRRPSRAATLLAPLALLIGLLSKESAILAVPLVALGDLRSTQIPRGRRALRYASYAAVTALALVARHHVVGVSGAPPVTLANTLAGAPLAARAVSSLGLFGRGLELSLAPLRLLPDYGAAIVTPSARPDLHAVFGAASLLALLAIAWRARRSPSPWSDAVFFLVVPGLLASNAILLLPGTFAERWWYAPSAGLCVLAGGLYHLLASRGHSRALALAAGALVLLGFSARTFARNRDWRSDETLFAAAVATDPRGAFAQYRLGLVRESQGRLADALDRYRAACADAPSWAEAAGARATLAAMTGHADEADAAFRAMRSSGGASHGARMNYVRFLAQQGRRDDAERELDALRKGQ